MYPLIYHWNTWKNSVCAWCKARMGTSFRFSDWMSGTKGQTTPAAFLELYGQKLEGGKEPSPLTQVLWYARLAPRSSLATAPNSALGNIYSICEKHLLPCNHAQCPLAAFTHGLCSKSLSSSHDLMPNHVCFWAMSWILLKLQYKNAII